MKLSRLALILLCSVFISLSSTVRSQTSGATKSGQSHELTEADDLSAQVVKLYEAGKYDEALPPAKRALKLRENALGPNDQLVAAAEINLAGVYLGKKNTDEAEALYRKALSIYEKEPSDPHVGQLLERIGRLRLLKNDFEKAEEFYVRAVAAKERAFGAEHAETIGSLNSLADFYNARHEYGKAVPLLQRVVSIREKSYGPQSPALAHSLQRLACVMFRDKRDAEAEKVDERANDILYKDVAARPDPVPLPLDVFACKIINNPRPAFPESAKGGRFRGETTLRVAVVVDESGNVTSARMVSGDPLFKESSEKAALKAQFRPTVVGGHPVKVSGEIVHQLYTKTSTVLVGPVPVVPVRH
ncbi:MAG: tetratricopeptide repeat protein [Acidobacteriota bacterium]|nr:tetratricopeptide repeat protein [Acidobacteriota bacterium]